MGPAFEARWEEFFQHRPDKAVAIFAAFAGCVHITFALMRGNTHDARNFPLYGLPPHNYLDACYFTVLLPIYP